ncbi:MAG: glycosyltransferase [Microgenomates group bacterium]
MKNKISAAIVVKNSPKYLNKTIESIYDFVDEIVLFDIGISPEIIDNLRKIKKVKIKKVNREVLYVEQIREEIKNNLKNDWILYLDPDEIFPEKTIAVIKKEINDYQCFSFPRKNIIFDQWIKSARFWPDYQPRLFKRESIFWPKQIHSKPVLSGKEYLFAAKEENAILHYNYENLNQWFEKFLRYAQVEAEYYFKNKKQLTFAETIKKALSEFISRYFAAHGYKDGLIGLSLSILQMFYYFVVYFYYLELKKFKEEITENYSLLIKNFFQNGFFETNFWLEKENLEGNLKKLKNKLINKLIKFLSH